MEAVTARQQELSLKGETPHVVIVVKISFTLILILNHNMFSFTAVHNCNSLAIVGNAPERSIPGRFFLYRRNYNNRPAYKHQDRDLYLYYHVGATCHMWIVGPRLGDSTGSMYNYDQSIDPRDITGEWTAFSDSSFTRTTDIKIVCY